MRGRVIAICILLASVLPGATADHAADPEDWYDASPVEPGHFVGVLDWYGNSADWYRVDHPVGFAVHATMSTPEGTSAHLHLRDAQGVSLGMDRSNGWPNYGPADLFAARGNATYVGVLIAESSGSSYSLSIELVELPDVAVTSIFVEGAHLNPAAPFQHVITVGLANLANGTGLDARAKVFVELRSVSDGTTRYFPRYDWTLTPHGATNLTLAWDSTGVIGDVEISAVVLVDLDANYVDNEKRVIHRELGGGFGQGYTIKPSPWTGLTCTPAAPASACIDNQYLSTHADARVEGVGRAHVGLGGWCTTCVFICDSTGCHTIV